ncbi:MAG TPA: peptide chain release factor N(5)-glutamine methyltransferase [Acidimicrobiia bacterium]
MTSGVTTWRELRADAAARLAAVIADPEQEARWMVEEVSGLASASLVAADGAVAPPGAAARLDAMLDRRTDGEPLQYVLGSWSFRGIDLFVDRRVLIPRPETEVTVEVAIAEAASLGARRGRRSVWSGTTTAYAVADLGTGSGAIALALAAELPDAEIWASDRSPEALTVTRANLAGAGTTATRVRVAEGDWFDALPDGLRGQLRLAVSNPPYVAAHELDDLPPEVARHEPHAALVSGPTGLEATARIIADAPRWLEPDGVLVVEIAAQRADETTRLAHEAGFVDVRVERDLTGRDRVLVARGPERGR